SRAPPGILLFPYTTLFRSVSYMIGFRGGARSACRRTGRRNDFRTSDGQTSTKPQARQGSRLTHGLALPIFSPCHNRPPPPPPPRSEEHTSELQSREKLVCR